MNDNEKITFDPESPIFEKEFNVEDKSIDNVLKVSLALREELNEMILREPFFKGQPQKKLDMFLELASLCAELAVIEDANFSIYDDGENGMFLFVISDEFYFSHMQMFLLSRICLLSYDMQIGAFKGGKECAISAGFRFSEKEKAIVDYVSDIYLKCKKEQQPEQT